MHCKDSVWYGVWLREGPGCLPLNRGSSHDLASLSVHVSKMGTAGLTSQSYREDQMVCWK